MTCLPAYGRDYKSAKDVKADWNTGKDFLITGIHRDSGRYVNKDDIANYNPTELVMVRYSKLTKTVQVNP